jgi:hypothetical protein
VVAPLIIASYLPWKRRAPTGLEYLLPIAILMATALPVIQGRAFQFRAADWKYPAHAADFVFTHRISVPMFNTWEFGAYLIWRLWPLQRVFIDGRAQSETVYLDYQRMVYNVKAAAEPIDNVYEALRPRVISGKSADELLDQYGIEMILMDAFEYTTGSPYLLVAALADPNQTHWKLIYRDRQAVIFMRHPPTDIQPLNPAETLDAMEEQCQEHLRFEPDTPRCAGGLADLFHHLGDRVRVSRWEAIAAAYGSGTE